MKINQTSLYRFFVRFLNNHYPVLLVKLRFRKLFRRKINLKNPQDLNEKILWLSLFSDTSKWSQLADKYAVRKYVEECGLEDTLVQLYGKWDRVEDIDWNSLPNSFVLKSNNSSGTVIIVMDKSDMNESEISSILKSWLQKKSIVETCEFHYTSIKPCIIAEELLMPSKVDQEISTSLIDYKIWCFNGKAHSIWACTNRLHESVEVASFDIDWNYHPEHSVFNTHYRESKILVAKPNNLKRMITVAETLAKPFPEVRVDLYNTNDRIYFGEMTFTSLGGTMTFYTQEFLLEMGNMVDISSVKKIR